MNNYFFETGRLSNMDQKLIKALTIYGLKDADVKLIRHYDNLIYRIKTKKVYALKICSPKINKKQLDQEVEWLSALLRDTNLLVPKPIPDKQGNLISKIEDRYCVLYEWLEGERVSQIMSSKIARQVGEMMAKLHLHASNYDSGDRLKNSTHDKALDCFDGDYFFGSNSWWQTKAKEQLPNDFEKMIPAVEKAKHLIESLSKSPDQFGMIHSDLHFSNIIYNGEKFAIIDFGDCAMGYYLMDIAVTETEFKDYSNADQLIPAFRESYQSCRGYFPSSEDVRTFEVMNGLLFLEWIFESKSQQVKADKAKWISQIIETIVATV